MNGGGKLYLSFEAVVAVVEAVEKWAALRRFSTISFEQKNRWDNLIEITEKRLRNLNLW